jgi:hypothetical protein
MRRMSAKLQPPTFEEGFTKITNVRVKKKEGEDAAPPADAGAEVLDAPPADAGAEVLDLSASASETPEEIGVATETIE